MPEPPKPDAITAIVVKGYPRLSETFIAQEILGLQQRGQRQLIVSLRRPTDTRVHAINRMITAPVLMLPEYLHEEPLRVLRGLIDALARRRFRVALGLFLADLRRDASANRLRRFGQACVLARELPAGVGAIHAHYLHTPASVARYAAALRGLAWSFSAHARDIWTTPDWEVAEKVGEAAWGVTCTAANLDRLRQVAGGRGRLALVRHGLDFSRFPAVPPERPPRRGAGEDDAVRILSVGRAVEKKGYDDLLAALALLPADLAWRFTHIGGGEELGTLGALAHGLRISGRIHWRGPQTQDEVIAAYLDADLFVLASRIAADGDRDGLPNVLMEAEACGLACISTTVSAIPELIDHERTGLLLPPGDRPGLAAAIAALAGDPDRRRALGRAGAARVREAFDATAGLDDLAARFALPPAPAPAAAAR